MALNAEVSFTWVGHGTWKVLSAKGKNIYIDPWVMNNPVAPAALKKVDGCDLILITHGHFDHVGDAVEIAKRTGAKLVSTFDLGNALVQFTGYPRDQVTLETQGNFGGELTLLDGEVKVAFIPAVHSSGVLAGAETHYGGNPAGFLITVRGGPVIYHTGDTDLFADMALIPRFRKVDLMLACIGDHFTMGPTRAAEAVKLVKPDVVIPMHFGTFPALTGTPEAFEKALKESGATATMRAMKIGETFALPNS